MNAHFALTPRRRQRGLTMIELMVGLAVGLAISIAVASVMALSAQSKRRTLGSGDLTQAGSYAQMYLDRAVRSAGSGLMQAQYAWGCSLQASKTISGTATQILPVANPGALPAPFGSVTTGTAGVFRLAPVLIGSNQTTPGVSGSTSDVLIVMAGHSGQSEIPLGFSDVNTATSLALSSWVGLSANDLLLVADRQTGASASVPSCLLTQVSNTYVASTAQGAVPLSGTYYAATINSKSLVDFSTDTTVVNLGNASDKPPNFQVIGVGDNNTLFSYDLLNVSSSSPEAIADSVFELKALYGVDTTGDGSIDSWQQPTGSYALASLMAGTTAAANTINTIRAVRVGLILRGSNKDSATVAPASLTLFSNLGTTLTYTRTLSTVERSFRYRTVDFTVPIVNSVLPFMP